jgi:hypothetical protein
MLLRTILEAIVVLLVVRAVWRMFSGMVTISAGTRRTTATRREPPPVKLVRDPVCGTYVSPDLAISDGNTYFCSEKCRHEYKRRA